EYLVIGKGLIGSAAAKYLSKYGADVAILGPDEPGDNLSSESVFAMRARANNNGSNPSWQSYEKLRTVIEKKMFSNTEDLLPVISFSAKANSDDQQKHDDFVARMVGRGYTEKQVRLLSEWYMRVRKSQ
ncbi:MAG: hypothetical protein AAF513_06420, partial [Pseudomonadota bacterium]